MSAKKKLTKKEFLVKVQEAADELTNQRNLEKITVFHHGGKFGYSRTGKEMRFDILEEALSRVNEKYEFEEDD